MTLEISIGQRIGDLTVLEKTNERSAFGLIKYRCQCECGNIVDRAFRSTTTKSSCGECVPTFRNEQYAKHRLRSCWAAMIRRCDNPTHDKYEFYGQRGVKVCQEWYDFAVFKEWALANGYADNLTIDRIDPNKGYQPDNCRYLTMAENRARAAKRGQSTFAQTVKMVEYVIAQHQAGFTADEIFAQFDGEPE